MENGYGREGNFDLAAGHLWKRKSEKEKKAFFMLLDYGVER